MACDDSDLILNLGPIPGPAGQTGAAGAASTVAGPAGVSAYTALTSAFAQPAVAGTVTATLGSTLWMVVGQALFIAGGGYYTVTTILTSTTVSLTRTAITGFAATAATVASGAKVSPAGYAFVDNSQYAGLNTRVTNLEGVTPGVALQTYYQNDAPTGTIATGSIWFDTNDGYQMYRYNAGWVAITVRVDYPDFGTGLRPVIVAASLPASGMQEGDLCFLTTDKKLYRYTGSAWTAAIAAGDLSGTLPSGAFAANTIATGVLQAGAVLASNIGSNTVITSAANIQDAVITNAKIVDLNVSKLTAGTIASKVIQISGSDGAIQSTNYAAGATGFKVSGDGLAEFNSVTIRGTLEAASIRTDSLLFNAGSTANKMNAITWQNGQVTNGGAGYTTLTVSGTVVSILSFYGWTHASGSLYNRFGKATTQFDCNVNGGATVVSGYCDLEMVYRINGGTFVQINPFAVRATSANGSLNVSGGVSLSGLTGGDLVEFGVRGKADNNATSLNVANLTVKSFNF